MSTATKRYIDPRHESERVPFNYRIDIGPAPKPLEPTKGQRIAAEMFSLGESRVSRDVKCLYVDHPGGSIAACFTLHLLMRDDVGENFDVLVATVAAHIDKAIADEREACANLIEPENSELSEWIRRPGNERYA